LSNQRIGLPVALHSGKVAGQPLIRICFRWTQAGAEEVEIVDYH